MLRADEKQVTEMAEAIAKKEIGQVLKKIDELAKRLTDLENTKMDVKLKGKTDAKL